MKREFQIRIEREDELMVCKTYLTLDQALTAYPKVCEKVRTENANDDFEFHAEIVEVMTQESFEAYRHKGCPCAVCGKRIKHEDDGESSENGSVHTTCNGANL